MKRIVLVITLLIIVASSVFADNQKIITVMDFETSGVSEQEMTLFVDYLSSSVSDYEEYILIDRRQRDIILAEAQFSNSGCADESCAIEIGQLLSASEMIVGSLGSIGSLYLLNIKLIDVETGKTISDVSAKYDSIESLVEGSDLVLAQLFNPDTIVFEKAESKNEEKSEIETKSREELSQQIIENNIINNRPPTKGLTNKEAANYYNLSLDMYNQKEINSRNKVIGGISLGLGLALIAFDIYWGIETELDAELDTNVAIAIGLSGGLLTLGGLIFPAFNKPVIDLDGNETEF